MMNSYKIYGDFMSFDITYNLVSEQKYVGDLLKSYGLGLMLGKSSSNKVIPFAFCLINT